MRFTKEELKRWEAAVRDHGGKEMPTINPNKLYSLKEAASIMELSEAGFRQHVYYSKHSPFLKKNAQRRGGRLFFKSETLIKLAEKLGRI